eukprot:TRINITY_DN17539_c0_g3_i1.p1 TRINITY_DN17539_c0_g3~~TRINITY_DN17539_c0_g3_i1.p1  ORF type:complete len:295 (-),score=29.35 TRINITY_DN17539_c0_g3_i1:545-1336(-)
MLSMSPLLAACRIGNLCLQIATQTFCTAVYVVDSACDLSQRLHCVMLLNKEKREELIKVSGKQLRLTSKKENQSQKVVKNETENEEQTIKAVNTQHRRQRSFDSPLEGLAELRDAQSHLDGEMTALDSYRSTISSSDYEEEEGGTNSCWSSVYSESSEVQSRSEQSLEQNSCNCTSTVFKKSTSFLSHISEDEETQNYIEDLQIQVSELMRTSSLVQQLQHRVQELEFQRDLLTRELLNTPKDLVDENERLKQQLQILQQHKP